VKPFLVLQLRPEDEAADDEFNAFLARGGLTEDQTTRIRLDQTRLPALSLEDYAGVIVGGGPGCVSDPPEKKAPDRGADRGRYPVAHARDRGPRRAVHGLLLWPWHPRPSHGRARGKGRYGEPIGGVDCTVTEAGAKDPLLKGLPTDFRALVGHKEAVETLPEGVTTLASSAPCPVQMVRTGRNVYATQFHPEANGETFATRIRIYNGYGYFDPDDAEAADRGCAGRRHHRARADPRPFRHPLRLNPARRVNP
jgi:GMP synthase (glutamine-hydrolysing)